MPVSNPVIQATWTALGANPVSKEVSLCTSPPDMTTCGSYGNASGRITSLVADPTNSQVAYAGSAGGGVWKTTNGGASWTGLTDSQPSLAIGALAVSPDGQIVYAGTGEDNTSESQAGEGILMSTNGGGSWTLTGHQEFAGHHIGGITIDRSYPHHVLVASDAGLYATGNDGVTWTPLQSGYLPLVTPIPGQTASGAVRQIIQDPDNVSKFWLSVSDDCLTEAGDVMVSTNNGIMFTNVTPGTLTQAASRIGLGVGHGGVAYYSASGCSGNLIDLQRTTSGGSSGWTQIYSAREYNPSSNPPTAYSVSLTAPGLVNYFNFGGNFGQGGYDNAVAVDPTDSNHAVFGGVTVLSTSNGGSSFFDTGRAYDPKGIIHPDYHAFAFTSHDHLYAGNDGGVYKTSNLGGVGEGGDWTNLNSNLDTLQYYNGTALDAGHILGGAQDNGSPGNFPGSGSLPQATQYLDGDGTVTALDPHSTAAWAAYPSLNIFKGDSTAPLSSFGPASPCVATGDPACGDPTDFVAPYLLDPSNGQRIIAGTNRVWYSASGGVPAGTAGWTAISGSLTNQSYANLDALTVLAMTPSGVTGEIVTGSHAGKVYVSRQAPGSVPSVSSWADISAGLPLFPGYNVPGGGPTGVEPNAWITGITINPSNPVEAWVTIGGLHVPHVWHTTTLTTTPNWTSIDGSGPNNVPDESADSVAFDAGTGTLYVGAETGILVCTSCAGAGAATTASWSTLGGLPNVKVNALSFTQSNELVAWTHGRGAWGLLKTSPALFVTPNPISLTCQRGAASAPPQAITVSNRGGGTLNWTVSNNANPPVIASSSGGALAAGASAQVTLTATCPAATGVYPASLVFGGNGGSPTVPASVVATNMGQYTPMPPVRILDTRSGIGHSGAVGGQPITVAVAGQKGVPAMGLPTPPSAAVINVTATNTTAASYLTVYPGPSRPTASNLNWAAGQTVANLVEVPLDSKGNVQVFNAGGAADVIFDVQGWVSTPGAGPPNPNAGLYNPLVPGRILDTRTPTGGHNGRMVRGETYTLQVAGAGQSLVPPAGANAVVLNLTETNLSGTTGDFLTVYPSDATQPTASNLNFIAGETRANRVIVKLGATGAIKIFNALGSVDVIVDVGGWFTDGASQTTGARFTGLSPLRILDTRDGTGGYTLALGPGTTYSAVIAGHGGVPSMDAIVPPTAVVMNVTSTNSTAPSFLTAYPADAQRAVISDLNWPTGANLPNLVVVKLSPDGRVNLYNPGGSVDVIADVVGWYG